MTPCLQGVMSLKAAQGQSEDGRTWKNCPYAVIVTPGRELADQVSPYYLLILLMFLTVFIMFILFLLLTQSHIPDW